MYFEIGNSARGVRSAPLQFGPDQPFALPSISMLVGPAASHLCSFRLEGNTPSLPWISLVGVFEGPRSACGCIHISSRPPPTQALEFCFRRDRLPPIPSLSPRGPGLLLRRTSSAIRPCQRLARHRPEPPKLSRQFSSAAMLWDNLYGSMPALPSHESGQPSWEIFPASYGETIRIHVRRNGRAVPSI
ncbi:hypothetical protein BDP81DRAFT_185808 [Colletotrichum phormii]|uniref:Uncharacterized protein n=1 Tax=Colletotrichum phormii TaxID=359342 RepID=A0AAI9ZXB9_9PEZI|nr:uncharacterized protein BDP81DRAFT_185808 [Colletotrichum phormii]KAK1639949.1 hypothetical protein BDP81DRAFT_185808 [Colletotrichum phormii]